MLKTVGTVREREREREHNSNELGFVCYTQNTVGKGTINVNDLQINIEVESHKKMEYMTMKNCRILCLFCGPFSLYYVYKNKYS